MTATARSENRYRQMLHRQASEHERARHERGVLRNRAGGVYDSPRAAVVETPRVTARQVTRWMRIEVDADPGISATSLGESAAAEFDLYDGDDVREWVWELAAAESPG